MVWHSVPAVIQGIFPKRIWKGDDAGDQVYLTFDDGPVPQVTDYVLNQLAKRNHQATFFMVGDNIRKHPELAADVLTAGHRIGNHTFHHLNGWKTPDSAYLENVCHFDSMVEDKFGFRPDLFRPPYGLVKNSQAKVLLTSKKLIMWNVLTGDYDPTISSSVILKNTKKITRAGSIILFHDQEKTRGILPKILPDYLDFLSERGFKTALL
jgi:peptidoglycan/xylan/chitin deacetylase (PgdA/CDA1 family)